MKKEFKKRNRLTREISFDIIPKIAYIAEWTIKDEGEGIMSDLQMMAMEEGMEGLKSTVVHFPRFLKGFPFDSLEYNRILQEHYKVDYEHYKALANICQALHVGGAEYLWIKHGVS